MPKLVIDENQRPGTTDWQLQNPADNHQIEGYASLTSVEHGGAIAFYVSTTARTYRVDIYRMGWYGGDGGRLMKSYAGLNGSSHLNQVSTDANTRMVSCSWPVALTVIVPTDWLSGVYLAKLTGDNGFDQYIIFVVRDYCRKSDYLFQLCVTTYQAYNIWGPTPGAGKSLYEDNSVPPPADPFSARAYAVSFNRPYYRGRGSGHFLFWEYPTIRWMESQGYDVSYCTNLDTHCRGEMLQNHKAFLSVGHDEYYSLAMRNAVDQALQNHVGLGYLGANAIYWQVRFSGGCRPTTWPFLLRLMCRFPFLRFFFGKDRYRWTEPRIMTCYKDPTIDPLGASSDPLTTVQWRDAIVARPEDRVLGVMWESYFYNNVDWIAKNVTTWPFANTNIQEGEAFAGITGYEYDRVFFPNLQSGYPSTAFLQWPATTGPLPSPLTIIAESPVTLLDNSTSIANSTVYQHSSGATVFAAGTIGWSWGLDDNVCTFDCTLDEMSWLIHEGAAADPKLQKLTANILQRLIQ